MSTKIYQHLSMLQHEPELYEADLIGEGYRMKRQIEDMRLYRKNDLIVIAKKDNQGKLEVLLNLKVLEVGR